MSADEQRKLAAIMFTDMVGYSALSQRDEKLAQELLEGIQVMLVRFQAAAIDLIAMGLLGLLSTGGLGKIITVL